MDIKTRRKALGWDRAELSRRAGVNPNAMQLIERGEWTEADALRRVDEVLFRAERGERDVQLPPPESPPRSA